MHNMQIHAKAFTILQVPRKTLLTCFEFAPAAGAAHVGTTVVAAARRGRAAPRGEAAGRAEGPRGA
eukprot:9765838-Lingulodinium_polyedra.AAC.1